MYNTFRIIILLNQQLKYELILIHINLFFNINDIFCIFNLKNI